jgi:hypothetical protein
VWDSNYVQITDYFRKLKRIREDDEEDEENKYSVIIVSEIEGTESFYLLCGW